MSQVKEVGLTSCVIHQHIENKLKIMLDSQLSQNSLKVGENTVLLHVLNT